MAGSIVTSRFFCKPVSFKWNIENYSEFPLTVEPTLTVTCDNEIYILTANRSKGVYITLEYKNKESSVEVWHWMALVDNRGNRRFEQRGSVKGPHCTSVVFDVLPDDFQKERGGLLSDDCLKIYGKLKHVRLSEDTFDESAVDSVLYYRPEELSTDFGEMLETKKNADVVLQVQEEQFHAHAAILSARSPVFAAMLEPDDTEKAQEPLSMTDVSPTAMRRLLYYIYTGKVEKAAEKVADFPVDLLSQLYVASDKYRVLGLKEMCSQIMRARISAGNLDEFAELAYKHNDAAFQASVAEFISQNESELDAKNWQQLVSKVPQLASHVLQFAFKKCKV